MSSKQEKNINKETKASSDFKVRFLFNISCLFRAKILFIFAIIYILTSFIFPLICFFINIQIASISWIYSLCILLLIMLIIIVSVFILYIENKENSIDSFFVSKGYTNLSSFFVKILAVCFFIFVIVCAQTMLMVIFMAVFRFEKNIIQFLVMNLFGAILFCLFTLPIFTCFSLVNSKIVFSIISLIVLVLPFSSLASRFSPINVEPYVYDGKNINNFVNSFSFDDKKTTSLAVSNTTGVNNQNNELFQSVPSYTPYLPGELLFSPFNVTYQTNQKFNSSSINDIHFFQTDINRPSFINSVNNYNSSNTFLFRPLDINIVELGDSQLREQIVIPLVDFYYKYDPVYHFSQMNIKQVYSNSFHDIFVDFNNLLCEYPSLFYMYRIAQIYNDKLSSTTFAENKSAMPVVLKDFVEQKIYKIIDAVGCATSPSYSLFLKASILPPNTELPDNYIPNGTFKISHDTILGIVASSNMAGNINYIYPYASLASVNFFEPICDTDYINFTTRFVNQSTFDAGSVELGFPSTFTSSNKKLNISKALRNSNLFAPDLSFEQGKNSAIELFIEKYHDMYPKESLANPEKWTNDIFLEWNSFLKSNYYWFNEYVRVLQQAASEQNYSVKPLIMYFNLTPNTLSKSTYATAGKPDIFNYLFVGNILYVPFNPNIWFGFIILSVISLSCWIILFLNFRSKKY